MAWHPPPLGVLRVNFDASVHADQAASGFVIRDYKGKLLRAGGKCLIPSSMPHVELNAAWLGLYAAVIELQAQRIWLEGDSYTVINWISKLSNDSYTKSPLLKDIMQWKKTRVFYASHIFREGNQVADHLVNCALNGDFYYTQQSVLSSQLVNLL